METRAQTPRHPGVREVPLTPEQLGKLRGAVDALGKKRVLLLLRTTETTYTKLQTTGAAPATVMRVVERLARIDVEKLLAAPRDGRSRIP